MFSSIRYKLLVSYLLLVTLGTGMLALYLLETFHSFYLNQVREDLSGRAMAVVEPVADALAANQTSELQRLAHLFEVQTHLTFRVFDEQMNLVVTSRNPPPDNPPWIDLPGMREAREGNVANGIMPDTLPGSEKLFVVYPVRQGQRRLGYLRLSLLLGEFQRVFARVRVAVALGLGAILTVCAALSLLLARSLSDPIRRMSAFAERVGAGQFGHRLDIHSSDEIGQLTAALNRMGERLDQHDQERREFLAAVSHELRTPAANIQVTLEAMLAGADSDPAIRERFLKAALSESERLSQLVRDLLELARLEAGGVRLATEPVRLTDLVAQAAEAMEPRLRHCSVSLEVNGTPDVWVLGDADRLLQVVMNLLDNAARYTHPECRISISVHAAPHEAVLRVEDEGPGIPEPDLPFIFDRFYTADKSRARDRSGTGLGLAIVRQIVEAHGGQVEADNAPGAGARFTVRLPRAATPREVTRSAPPS